MTRPPAPRKSRLSGSNSTAPSVPSPDPVPEPVATPEPEDKRVQATLYALESMMGRFRGAVKYAGAEEGYKSLNDLIFKSTLAEVERLETKHNNGEPFPRVGTGSLKLGARRHT